MLDYNKANTIRHLVGLLGAFRNFPKITRKLSSQPDSNIKLFPTHTKLILSVLGVAGKLVKNVVQLYR
jgi:hypothetical protein